MTSFALIQSSDLFEYEIYIPKEYYIENFEEKRICPNCKDQMPITVGKNFTYGSCCKKLFILTKSFEFYSKVKV